jgi:hypothetical protein
VPLATFGAALCLFCFLFDLWLNARRQLVWYYLGTDPQTATTDEVVSKLKFNGKTFALLKLGGAVARHGGPLLASCATSKPEPVDTISMLEPRVKIENPISDSVKPVPEKKGILSWLKKPTIKTSSVLAGRKIKNSTIIIQQGQGNAATSIDAKKAEAPIQTGKGNTATDNTKAGQKGGAAATAPNATATATTEKESWVSAVLPYALGLGGLGLLYSLLPLGLAESGWLWVLLQKGRSREPETG